MRFTKADTFEEFLEGICQELMKHEGHRLVCRFDDSNPDQVAVWCGKCGYRVVCGSESIVDFVWSRPELWTKDQ